MMFKPGKSGNPKGRPKGIPNPSAVLRQQIAEHIPEIINTLVVSAKGGDTQAASLLLSRCLPPVKPQTEGPGVALPGQTIVERAEAIADAAMSGALSPTAAGELMGILGQQARIQEFSEFAERLERLEAALKQPYAVPPGTKR